MAEILIEEDRVGVAHAGDTLVHKGITSCVSVTFILSMFKSVVGGHVVAVNAHDPRSADQRLRKILGQMQHLRHVKCNSAPISGIVVAGVIQFGWVTDWISKVRSALRLVRNDFDDITWYLDLTNTAAIGNDVKFDVDTSSISVVRQQQVLFYDFWNVTVKGWCDTTNGQMKSAANIDEIF